MAQTESSSKKQTWRNSLLGMVLTTCFSLILALLFSIVIEIVGMNLWWEDQGVSHSANMFEYEISQLELSESGIKLSDGQHSVIGTVMDAYELSERYWSNPALIKWLERPLARGEVVRRILRDIYVSTDIYLEAAGNMVRVFFLRLAILILSLPIFILAFFVGVIDGLVERDLRRWGGGRESSTMFGIAKASMAPMALASWIIYLSVPFSINPSLVITPFVILFGLSVRITTDRLKKYF